METKNCEISAHAIQEESVVNFQNEMDNFFFGTHLCEILPYGMISTARYPKFHEGLQNFEVFEDDVFVVTHPKAGTRWMQELVWRLRNDINLTSNTKDALVERVPFLDLVSTTEEGSTWLETVAKTPQPRTFKSHCQNKFIKRKSRSFTSYETHVTFANH
uniref:Sulfotransferase domain-containing protein n=1 Tax=Clytia hemisphaerica TaxID=252671 RepID=A0A7M5X716_9CNID